MNRQEAVEVLMNLRYDDCDKRNDDAMNMAIAALKPPTPDPTTGLMPCGCGGKATITERDKDWLVKCDECGIELNVYGGRGGAVWSWNTAMSGNANFRNEITPIDGTETRQVAENWNSVMNRVWTGRNDNG